MCSPAQIVTEPEVGASEPSSSFSSVVLPEPFRPITAVRRVSRVRVVSCKPVLPSSYVYEACANVNVTWSGRGVSSLRENNPEKIPIPVILAARTRLESARKCPGPSVAANHRGR